ncbi:MAG TPA: TIGR00725 family protein [Symbiobacteriaceae bacterium]
MPVRIGVIGQYGSLSPEVATLAYTVGREIALRGGILFSGGRDGVMEAASRGAKEAGGLTVGILPGDDVSEGNPWLDVPITTGLGFDFRSNILIHSVDAVIMVAGGNGTLGELSTAYLNRKPSVVLTPSGGWSARIQEALYDRRYLDERRSIEIAFAETAAEAVAAVWPAPR